MTTNDRRLLAGLAAGIGAALIGTRVARSRRAIDFGGRVVVITGGSRGLGFVLARKLAAQGARLVLLARNELEIDRAQRLLQEEFGADVLGIRCDVTRREDVRSAVAQVLDRWMTIDVLINNAGVIQVGPLEHMTLEDFEGAMATHFRGPLHTMLEVLPAMRDRGFGRIVNISSIGGAVAVPHLAPYCASKFALTGLSDAFRAELARTGIRVTTVCPGLMRTGSPPNVDVKGHHEAEYTWFAISAALPGLSISAERAADQILTACAYGDPELTITPQARLAAAMNGVAPGVVAAATALAARVLPGPTGPEGDVSRRGRDTGSSWAPSLATRLNDRVGVLYNEG